MNTEYIIFFTILFLLNIFLAFNFDKYSNFFKIVDKPDDLRKLLKKSYPSITYGANNSTIESLSVSSNTSDKISSVLMLRSYINRNNPLGGNDTKSQLQETRVVPASINLSIFTFFFVEISTINVSPDISSEINSNSSS